MNTFLYKTGDECVDITGGFISSPYTLAGTSVTVIKNSDNMQLNPNGTGRHTTLSHNTAINLTKYKSIYFDIEVVSTLGTNQWPRLGLSTNNNQNDYGVGEVTIENTIGRKLYHIDLTDKTDLAFVKAHINCGAGAVSPFMNIKIYNIWLEENFEKLPVSTDLSSAIQYSENIESKISTLKIKLENNLIQKGVSCSNTDKFSSLINKVQDIKTGVNVTIDNSVKVDYDFNLTLSNVSWVDTSAIQRNFYNGSAVIFNNEIHILGGQGQSLKHHKYDGSSWSKVSDLPYNFQNGSAVVLNNEIHILGGTNSTYFKYHYKYDGASWSEVSTLPYDFQNGSAVVFNNEIHILGSTNSPYFKYHYKYDGASWTSVSDLPYNFQNGSAVVLNNEIHILGGDYSSAHYKKHYKWNGSTWTSVSTLPYNFYNGDAVVYNNEIHILGGNGGINTYCKYNGSSWSNLASIPYYFTGGSAVELNNEIHILGSNYSSTYYTKHYKAKFAYELEVVTNV